MIIGGKKKNEKALHHNFLLKFPFVVGVHLPVKKKNSF